MPVTWRSLEAREKLLSAWLAAHLQTGASVDYNMIAKIYGEGTNGPAVRFQFDSALRPRALELLKDTFGADAKVQGKRKSPLKPKANGGVKKRARTTKSKKVVEEDSETPDTTTEEDEGLFVKTEKRGFTPVPRTPIWREEDLELFSGDATVEEKEESSDGDYC